MPHRKHAASRLQPKQQLLWLLWLLGLLAVVLVAPVVASGTSSAGGVDETATPPPAQTSEIPLVTDGTPSPTVTTPPASPPPIDRPPSADRPPPTSSHVTLEPKPTDSVGTATMPASTPVRLRIPSIGVDTRLMDLGLQADRTLEVPSDGFPAGWYTGGPTPGELGPAIIAGHVDWAGQPGVFFALRDLASGDEIVITRGDGSTARFRVVRVERYDKDEFPTQAVYGDLDHAGLRLITCGGDFDRQARSYVDNLVVFAELTDNEAR